VLSSTRSGKDDFHPNLPLVEINDTIELLNIELDRRYLHVDLALIPIVVNSGRPHDRIDWGSVAETNHRIY